MGGGRVDDDDRADSLFRGTRALYKYWGKSQTLDSADILYRGTSALYKYWGKPQITGRLGWICTRSFHEKSYLPPEARGGEITANILKDPFAGPDPSCFGVLLKSGPRFTHILNMNLV